MEPVPILFGLACVGAIAASARVPSFSAQVLALLLGICWASANILWLIDGIGILPLVDLPIAMAAYVVWFDGRREWQGWVAGAFAARLASHLLAAWGTLPVVAYLHSINALFLASLIAVSWEGGIRDGAGLCGRGLRRIGVFLASRSGALLAARRLAR